MQPVDGSILQVLGGLSGEPLTVHLTSQEAKKIESVRDLKRCLTRNVTRPLGRTPGTPFSVHWIRLIHTDASMASMELHDEDPVNPETWEWLEQGSLRYMRADVFSFPPEALPSGDDLKFSYENLEELLDPKHRLRLQTVQARRPSLVRKCLHSLDFSFAESFKQSGERSGKHFGPHTSQPVLFTSAGTR